VISCVSSRKSSRGSSEADAFDDRTLLTERLVDVECSLGLADLLQVTSRGLQSQIGQFDDRAETEPVPLQRTEGHFDASTGREQGLDVGLACRQHGHEQATCHHAPSERQQQQQHAMLEPA
jgi:hypothetical protein